MVTDLEPGDLQRVATQIDAVPASNGHAPWQPLSSGRIRRRPSGLVYEHADTEVAFTLDDRDADGYLIRLNLPRPSAYGREALRALTALEQATRARFVITADERTVDAAGLVSAWHDDNAAAAKALAREGHLHAASAEAVDAWWRWQYDLTALRALDLGDIWVPSLSWSAWPDRPQLAARSVIWAEGIPMAWPDADVVLLLPDAHGRDGMFQVDAGTARAHVAPLLQEVSGLLGTVSHVPEDRLEESREAFRAVLSSSSDGGTIRMLSLIHI